MNSSVKSMDRRKFLSFLTGLSASSLLSVSLYDEVLCSFTGVHRTVKGEKTLPFTIHELILKAPKDIMETDPHYLKMWSESSKYIQTMQVIEKAIKSSKAELPQGNIVVLGAYKCEILDMLKRKYISKNYIGVDTTKYTDHPNLVINDVKTLKAGDLGPISYGCNSVFLDWKQDPRSKLAGFNFLKESLVSGGLLIELPSRQLPRDLNTKGLRLINSSRLAMTWKKV